MKSPGPWFIGDLSWLRETITLKRERPDLGDGITESRAITFAEALPYLMAIPEKVSA